jgi:UDP-N-acetylmuramate dehydrogenase
VLVEVEAIRLDSAEPIRFSNEECRFEYRHSIFKTEWRDRLVVTAITLRLSKRPELNTTYGAIAETLEAMGVTSPTIRDVSDAVIAIRRSKLPDPGEIGNAGSFFKNPVIPVVQFEMLKSKYPNLPSYPQEGGDVKVPAGWLIEQAGWKGKRVGHVGMHAKQALVLVNYGGATGAELYQHAQAVKQSVAGEFGIELEEEVRVI